MEQTPNQSDQQGSTTEENYRSSITAMAEGIVLQDAGGAIIAANAAAERILGLSGEQLMGRTSIDPRWRAIHEDGSPFPGETHPAMVSLQTGRPVRDVIMGVHKPDGSLTWISINAEPLRGVDAPVPNAVVSTFHDISERKPVEKALQESRRNLQLFVEYAPAAIAMFDRDMRYLAASRRYIVDYRLPSGDIIGRSHYDIFPEIPQRWKEIHRRCLAGAIEQEEAEPFPRADGTLDWVRWEIHPWYEAEGMVGGVILFSEVITNRVRLEQERAKLAERLNLATRSAHMGIWDWDIQQNELIWDKQMYALYGLKPGEFRGAYEAWLCGIHPEDRDSSNDVSAAALRGEQEYDTEFRVRWPDGSVHWLKANAQVFRAENGTPLRMVGVNYDITESKRLEESLRESEQKYTLLFEKSTVPTVLLKLPEVVIIDVNEACEKLTGFTRSEMFGKTSLELGLARKEERAQALSKFDFHGALAGNEIHLFTKAGEQRIVVVNTTSVKIGEQICAITTMQDITERKQAEENLRRRTEELEQLLDILPEAIWIADDPACNVIRGNRFANELLGISKDDNISQSADAPAVVLRQFSQGRELNTDELPMQMAGKTGKPQLDVELRIDHPSKSSRILLGGAVPLFDEDGKARGVVATFQDITERKKAEERFQRSFQSNPIGMNIIDLADGTIVDVNDAFLAIFGVTREQVIGKTSVEAGLSNHPEERQQFLALLSETGKLSQRETEFQKPNGEKGHIIVSAEVIEIGEKRYGLVVSNDISERKRMENELRRSNAELEQFAYVASHDLQEPLRAVAGMVQLIGQKYKGQLDERADEYIAHAVEAAGRMQALINDLLAYSRVDRRSKALEPVQASACLQGALRNLNVSIQESGAIVSSDELPIVYADPTQLVQLFQNLIGNAIKFRGKKEAQIHIGVAKLNDAWQFSVRDNGIGIEPQYFERIFLVFQRLHTRREYPGTGIGLALCKKIVERHGGTIWVESQPGQGSTFYFTLPMRGRG